MMQVNIETIRRHLTTLDDKAIVTLYKTTCRKTDRTMKLYKDLLQYVFSYLDAVLDMPRIRGVCKRWNSLSAGIPNILTTKVINNYYYYYTCR